MMNEAFAAMRADPRQTRKHYFWQLVERFRADLVNQAFTYLGCRTDAEDVAQESLCFAFRKLDELKDPSKLGNWLRSINRHNCLAARSKRARQREVRPTTAEYESLPSQSPQPGEGTDTRLEAVARVIDGLQRPYRDVLVLRYWERMTYAQIAERLHIPLGTVKTRLARGDALLLDRLAPLMQAEKEKPNE
jgi:RNA polymerase sigma-70 factor (ECF subfamily)